MDYFESYRFVFRSRNWAMNLLLVVLCWLIPIVGALVLMGYLFEIIEFLLGSLPRRARTADYADDAIVVEPMEALPADAVAEEKPYSDFAFERFAEYLLRGVWPFLVTLIASLILGAASLLLWVATAAILGAASAASQGEMGALPVVVFGVFFICYLVLAVMMNILMTPLYLRAGLSGDFASAFSMDFFSDFLKRVGKEVLLAKLFLIVSGPLAAGLGLMLCCVGMYPALAIVMFASHHLDYQLYRLYLERGGEPIEDKQSTVRTSSRRIRKPGSGNIMRSERDEW